MLILRVAGYCIVQTVEHTMSVAGNISKKGKGLPRNGAERLALCKSAHVMQFDPVRGTGMKITELARRLKAEFLCQAPDCLAKNLRTHRLSQIYVAGNPYHK
jgi:hypothetical protein